MARADLLTGIVRLSEEQYNYLIANGYVTAGDKTIVYDENTVYVTPTEETVKGDVDIDNLSITKNDNDQIQTVGVIDQKTKKVNKEWTGTQAQYDAIVKKDPDTLYYITDGKSSPSIGDLTLSITDTEISSLHNISSVETFTHHVHVMLEFETDGVHGGTDFILHPYDSSVCYVTYSILLGGQLYSSGAYLDEQGHININIPIGLTFTNVKGHYIEYGG